MHIRGRYFLVCVISAIGDKEHRMMLEMRGWTELLYFLFTHGALLVLYDYSFKAT